MAENDGTDGRAHPGSTDDGSRHGDDSFDRPPSERVIDAVATETGVDPTALDPLAETVDVDALNALFAPAVDDTPRAAGRVTLEYGGLQVTVRSDGTVAIDKPPDD